MFYSLNNSIEWIEFNQTNFFNKNFILGFNSANLTIKKEFFKENNQIFYWRFQLFYFFDNDKKGLSALDFHRNQCPRNGFCSISPSNGTTKTLFTINCSNWYDEDGIKDYSFYSNYIFVCFHFPKEKNYLIWIGWTKNQSEKLMFSYTKESRIEVQLSPGDEKSFLINIQIVIRDQFYCQTYFHINSLTVLSDLTLLNNLEESIANQTIENLFFYTNRNEMTQRILSLSIQLNQKSFHQTHLSIFIHWFNWIERNSFLENLFVSPLNNQHSILSNDSISDQLIEKLNNRAKIRNSLIKFLRNFSIEKLENLKLEYRLDFFIQIKE